MMRLLQIEFAKLWAAKYFRVLAIMWLVAFISIPFGAKIFLYFLETKNVSLEELGILPSQLPIFDFNDIWQNLAYIYKCISILLSFIVVISVTNDLDYKTFRQNIIDGLSRKEWLLSKLYLILVLATVSTVLVFVLGMIAGLLFSAEKDFSSITAHIEFVGAYWIHVVLFLNLCMLVSLIIRRAGITIAALIFWIYIFEFIGTAAIMHAANLPLLSNSFPFEASWNMIHRPIEKYFLSPNQDFVSMQDIIIGFAWLAFSMFMSWRIAQRRDL